MSSRIAEATGLRLEDVEQVELAMLRSMIRQLPQPMVPQVATSTPPMVPRGSVHAGEPLTAEQALAAAGNTAGGYFRTT